MGTAILTSSVMGHNARIYSSDRANWWPRSPRVNATIIRSPFNLAVIGDGFRMGGVIGRIYTTNLLHEG